MEVANRKAPKRIATAVINSMKGGVVPRVGLAYVTVGRKQEIASLLHDIDTVEDGGASFRVLKGKYGSGKSFLLQTIRNYAMDRGFVVADADLSPERLLHGGKGKGLATYKELMKNLAVKTKPEGGALQLVLDRWIESVSLTASPLEVENQIKQVIKTMGELVHGFDYGHTLAAYYAAHVNDNEEEKSKVVRWLRGEYATKTEAKRELGVNAIVTDDDWYDYLKLMALFLKQAGYKGLIVLIDELVNVYNIPNSLSRNANYEKLLTLYNDALQGKAQWIGTIVCGTPECVENPRRGLYSYNALKTRLQGSRFEVEGLRNLMGPVIDLEPLSAEEITVLISKLSELHAIVYDYTSSISDQQIVDFLKQETERMGANTHLTPREVSEDWIGVLDFMLQYPNMTVSDILGNKNFTYAQPELEQHTIPDEFEEFDV